MDEGAVVQLLGPSAGGIRRHVSFLSSQLEERGWRCVVAGPAGVLDGVGRQDSVVDVALSADPRRLLGARRAVAELAAGADLVHAHGLKAGWLASLARPRPRLVVTVHNLVLDEAAGPMAPLLRGLEGRLAGRCDRLIAVSEQIAERFGGPGPRVSVIAPASPAPVARRPRDEVRAAHGIEPGRPLVVTVARLHPQKDLPTFLVAIDWLRARVPDVAALVVGEGPDEGALRSQADAMGLSGVVTFTGPSPHAADEINAADVVVMSSRWEGSPLVAAEALLLGRPLVATAVGAIPALVTDGETGRLVGAGDPAALGRAIAEVLADPSAAARMGAAGRARAVERLGPDRLVSLVEGAYRATLMGT